MFPIHDQRGRVTGFGGRALDNETQPKYLNSPQSPVFDKSDTLYGIHLAAQSIRQLDQAVIVEGYFDVIVPHQYGFSNVVASMGIAITDRQVTRLKRLTKNLAPALDPDEAGEEAMARCIDYEGSLGAEIRVISPCLAAKTLTSWSTNLGFLWARTGGKSHTGHGLCHRKDREQT